jgi:HlyD family secretion protein
MKKLVKIVVILGVAAAIAFVVKTKLSESNAVEDPLTLYGNVDIRQVSLGFRTSGRIGTMVYEEGDAVKEGQLLASLDKGPLKDNLALFRAQVNVTEAAVAKLEAGTRREGIAIASSELEVARASVAQAER